jgi:DNA-binding PadR family transcriptional regulator
MMNNKLYKKYIPMTETAYYILLALKKQRHGYGVLGHVEKITHGRIRLGAGTIYGTLSKMLKDGVIKVVSEHDRRKTYIVTDIGSEILSIELKRLEMLVKNGREEA